MVKDGEKEKKKGRKGKRKVVGKFDGWLYVPEHGTHRWANVTVIVGAPLVRIVEEVAEGTTSLAGSEPVNITLTVEGLELDHNADISHMGVPPKHASTVVIRNSIRKMATPYHIALKTKADRENVDAFFAKAAARSEDARKSIEAGKNRHERVKLKGWLTKSSAQHRDWPAIVEQGSLDNSTTWKRLWISVSDVQLSFFEDDHSYKVLGTVDLNGFKLITEDCDRICGRRHSFAIVTIDHDCVVFSAASQSDLANWIKCLRKIHKMAKKDAGILRHRRRNSIEMTQFLAKLKKATMRTDHS